MSTVKPFETKGFFVIHNCVFDTIMPNISPNAFKVLCTAIRQTLGWHKESDLISYSQFLEKTGIKSRSTVSSAIQECLDKRYLLRVEQEQCTNLGKPSFFYRLNTDFELEDSSTDFGLEETSSPVFGLGSSTEIGLGSSTVFGHTKEHQITQHDDDDLIIKALQDFGLSEKMARKLAIGANLKDVQGWIQHIESNDAITNPIGFLVCKLRDREKPPKAKEDDNPSDSWIAAGALH
ncbi:MAG TPA: replication protein [Anaerolineae bacterium]|nr:replication protein [Anaerolineae bacterium]